MNFRKFIPFISLLIFIPLVLFFVNSRGNSTINVNVDTGESVSVSAILEDVVQYTSNEQYVQIEVSYSFDNKNFNENIYIHSGGFSDSDFDIFIYVDHLTGKPTSAQYIVSMSSEFINFPMLLMYVPTIAIVGFTVFQRYKKMKYDPFKDENCENESNYFDEQYCEDTKFTSFNDDQQKIEENDCSDDPFNDFYNKKK